MGVLGPVLATLLLGFTNGASIPECCKEKMVGGVSYVLKEETDTERYGCKSNCVFERVDSPGSKYCFKEGDLEVVCEDDDNGGGGCNKCGVKKSGSRIVGGQNADVNEYPWMTLLAITTERGVQGCGGSIINSKWVMTALHCVVKSTSVPYADLEVHPVNIVRIIVGDHQLSVLNETGIQRTYSASEIVIPEESIDFALIKVEGDIDLSIHTPICLPSKGDNFTGGNTVVTGWGRNQSSILNDSIVNADILQEILLPITTSTQCNNIIFEWLNITVIDQKHLCFGSGEEGKGGCFGDSGGPIIVQKEGQSSWTLAGVVSGGTQERCSAGGSYGIAVNVASFIDFIKETAMDGEFCVEN